MPTSDKTMYVGYYVYEYDVYLVAISTNRNSILGKLKEKAIELHDTVDWQDFDDGNDALSDNENGYDTYYAITTASVI